MASARKLTPANHIVVDYLGSPPELSDYVTTFYHFRCDDAEITDIQPAAVGHLAIFPYGKGQLSRGDGGFDRSHHFNLLTPLSRAAPFFVEGPFHAIGAALTPLGWAELTGLCARKHGNRLYAARDWLGDNAAQQCEDMCAAYRADAVEVTAIVTALGAIILAAATPIKQGHAELIATTNRWLSAALMPGLEGLYEQSSYSQRQTQRLVERYFGLSPVALRRKYRALRAATLLSLPELTPEYEASIGDAFYDQSHMIREIRYFAGRTPARLGDDSSPFLSEMLAQHNFRELGASE